ncbi:MAG: 4-amino-4-deoxy-L-arabinose transferase and related glycosyltransferases of PMT family [Nitrospira sp.]|jgi:4-amino-4-deoxy-L-arabinose transferase-like glycosyltransferase|nr:MAG: 4-amino-4-deoxy-L-arabinose transferase and related glycosyltransferases of PMT family [Nitrospira sp.]
MELQSNGQPPSPETSAQDDRSIQPPALLLLLAMAAVLFFVGLGSTGLTDRDEGRNAEAGREMYETGDYISPTFNYEPRFAKPVFVYWLMSLSYHLFGVNEFAARFPSALFGVGLILLQYLFVTRCRGPIIGLFGAAMLLLNLEIIGLGRMALTDSVLNFFTTLSLYGFWLGLYGRGRERHCMWLFYVGMALGTLTKGPIGFLIPLLAAGLYLWLTGSWSRYRHQGFPVAGLLVFLVLALPWYLMMWNIHGQRYTTSAQGDTVGRFFGAMEGHGGTIFFYLPVFLLGFFPWSGLLPFAWYQAYKSWRESKRAGLLSPPRSSIDAEPSPLALEWFAAAWVIGGLVFFSLSSTRLPHYIAPLFPAAAILTASYWHRCVTDPAVPGVRAALHTITAVGSLLAIAFASLPPLYAKFAGKLVNEFPLAGQVSLGPGPYTVASIFLVGMGLVAYFGFSETRRPAAFWAAGGSLALVVLAAVQLTFPLVNLVVIDPPQRLAEVAGVNLGPNDRLIVYGQPRPSLVFYAKRKAIMIPKNEEANITPYLTQPGRTMILLPAALRGRLPLETMDYPVLLERFGYILLANQSMVHVPEQAEKPPIRIPGH